VIITNKNITSYLLENLKGVEYVNERRLDSAADAIMDAIKELKKSKYLDVTEVQAKDRIDEHIPEITSFIIDDMSDSDFDLALGTISGLMYNEVFVDVIEKVVQKS